MASNPSNLLFSLHFLYLSVSPLLPTFFSITACYLSWPPCSISWLGQQFMASQLVAFTWHKSSLWMVWIHRAAAVHAPVLLCSALRNTCTLRETRRTGSLLSSICHCHNTRQKWLSAVTWWWLDVHGSTRRRGSSFEITPIWDTSTFVDAGGPFLAIYI
jgi:hypothetical protein